MKHLTILLLALFVAAPVAAQCVDGDCVNGYGHMKYDDGSGCDGQWENGNRHGVGTLKLANGGEFIGDWVDDERKGKAVGRMASL